MRSIQTGAEAMVDESSEVRKARKCLRSHLTNKGMHALRANPDALQGGRLRHSHHHDNTDMDYTSLLSNILEKKDELGRLCAD